MALQVGLFDYNDGEASRHEVGIVAINLDRNIIGLVDNLSWRHIEVKIGTVCPINSSWVDISNHFGRIICIYEKLGDKVKSLSPIESSRIIITVGGIEA